ncbi:PREDICTED: golgin subfamily A member 4-like [Branchiostoma belcheri]|uniref:Golgin subfamily A member 4-like n=1 Tax=Branchiostoma belcheri TaxID=7741 RepID=A0A6P4ZEG0_BRABE|nr:PREDICTED: golgin subfamily A member 4-like [Branchiostoma belcheri]
MKDALRRQEKEGEDRHQDEVQSLTEEWHQERQWEAGDPEAQVLEEQNMLARLALEGKEDVAQLLKTQAEEHARQIKQLKKQLRKDLDQARDAVRAQQNRPQLPPDGDVSKDPAAQWIEFNRELQAQLSQQTAELEGLRQRERQLKQRLASAMGREEDDVEADAFGPLLTEPTETEYLKKVLFEYMMGRETKTMAKVIAAILKFPAEQTRQILEQEETKTTS